MYILNALRDIRFGPPGTGGTDLAALDIQRGRDHGLVNNYRLMRQSYNLGPLADFNQLTSDPQVQAALASVYGTTENLDSFVAMIAEDHVPGTSLGSLALAIIESQFTRLRDGDRFFFTGDTDMQSDLVRSVVELDSLTLSDVIRRNSGITRIQGNVFLVVPEPAAWLVSMLGMLLVRCSCVQRNGHFICR